ncbi:hypothetical protein AA313_de0207207 [Arthrobotrys entomopaga]|nr:hypothetical protein AA313_de0207207 [Arthrobotrys entomopaga]
MDPGTIIAISELGYKGAIKAIKTVLIAIHFPKESQDLFLQLQIEQFRLQVWGRTVGLERGRLVECLHPVFSAVRDMLDKITVLFQDLAQLQEKFGLVLSDQLIDVDEEQKSLSRRLNEELKRQGLDFHESAKTSDEEDVFQPLEKEFFPRGTFTVTFGRRVKWAMGSKNKFRDCIKILEGYINKLNQLLNETQHQAVQQDLTRINIIIVGKAEEADISILRDALTEAPSFISLKNLLERKAIATAKDGSITLCGDSHLTLREFNLPDGYSVLERFGTTRRDSNEQVILEKKSFDDKISLANQPQLEARLDRLVALLHPGKSKLMLKALGYITDARSKCWWLVFQVPAGLTSVPFSMGTAPSTLRDRLGQHRRYDFSLETRLRLAYTLASAYSDLFSGGWLHKGIGSRNIIYLSEDLLSPFIVGFEFARQELEISDVDAAKTPSQIDSAMYRHSNYIPGNAQGYMMHYDIYSFGLLLVEIAMWEPLSSLAESLKLNIKNFQASELQNRVKYLVQQRLAFYVGDSYRILTSWCLNYADVISNSTPGWHPALDFNDHVLVPLNKLSKSLNYKP